MAKSTIRVTNDKGFGGYYGNLRKWEGLKRKDLQWHDQDLPNAAAPESDGLTWDQWCQAEEKLNGWA